jgi:hypothetical protein
LRRYNPARVAATDAATSFALICRLSADRNRMIRSGSYRLFRTAFPLVFTVLALTGCGTTRSSDSARTATEQLLISDAIDRAVQTIDFAPLRAQAVYLDDSKLEDVVDKHYLISTLRQHILASGCTLKNTRNEADFIVEARAGAVGTDRNDLLFGIPATNVPQLVPLQGVPTAIPEVPLAKRLDQRGVAKISMFAYHRETGRPVWQSGLASRESSSNDVWLFGAGPFQYGSVLNQHPDAQVSRTGDVSTERDADPHRQGEKIKLAQQVVFAVPEKLAKEYQRLPATEAVAKSDAKIDKSAAVSPAAVAPPTTPIASSQTVSSTATSPKPFDNQAARKAVPRLTGSITAMELLKNASPKTAEMLLPPRDSNAVSLPQPRYDSL